MFAGRRGRPLLSDGDDSSGASSSGASCSDDDGLDAAYEPSMAEVLIVKMLLSRMAVPFGDKKRAMPFEVINMILDDAEYWPHSTTLVHFHRLQVRAGYPEGENKLLLRCRPLGFLENPLPSPKVADSAEPIIYPFNAALPPAFFLHPLPGLRRPDDEPAPACFETAFDPEVFQSYIAKRWNSSALLAHPCRKIVFTIVSHDQGWEFPENYSMYKSTWTWFEAGLERFDASAGEKGEEGGDEEKDCEEQSASSRSKARTKAGVQQPSFTEENLRTVLPEFWTGSKIFLGHPIVPSDELTIQRNFVEGNPVTSQESRQHRVVWSWNDKIDPTSEEAQSELGAKGRGLRTGNGRFVRDLKLGDVVTVWAKARFPQWVNCVHAVRVDIYWAI